MAARASRLKVAGVRSRSLDLQHDRLGEPYRARLDAAGERLRRWCVSQQVDFLAAVPAADQVNLILIRYLQDLFNLNAAYWWAAHAVLYVQTTWRHLKGALRPSWDSVLTWKLHMPVSSRVPVRFEIVEALAYAACLFALHFDCRLGPFWIRLAACLRFAFFGLLRPKELFRMQNKHVMVPRKGAHTFLRCAVATVTEPKNRAAGGRVQARLIRNEVAVQWLSWLVTGSPADDFVWPHGAGAFAKGLRKLLRFIGLESSGITPSSFRAGGATWLLEEGWSVSHIRFTGGWATEKTLSAYLQEAECAQVLLRLSDPQADWLDQFLRTFAFFQAPPVDTVGELTQQWTRTRPGSC